MDSFSHCAGMCLLVCAQMKAGLCSGFAWRTLLVTGCGPAILPICIPQGQAVRRYLRSLQQRPPKPQRRRCVDSFSQKWRAEAGFQRWLIMLTPKARAACTCGRRCLRASPGRNNPQVTTHVCWNLTVEAHQDSQLHPSLDESLMYSSP